MMSEPNDALNYAVEFELESQAMYRDAKTKTAQPLAQSIFDFLIEQEGLHVEIIRKIQASIDQEKGWPAGVTVPEMASATDVITKLKGEYAGSVEISTNEQEALGIALELEGRGLRMYTGFAGKAVNDAEQTFYEKLAGEEAKHYDLVAQFSAYFFDMSDLRMDGDAGPE